MYDDLAAADGALPSPTSFSHIDRPDDITMRTDPYNTPIPAPIYEHPCSAVTKIFTSGTFYYTPYPVWDLSSRLDKRRKKAREEGGEVDPYTNFDERFVWNEYLAGSLLDFRERLDANERADLDRCGFIVRFCGPSPVESCMTSLSTIDSGDPGVRRDIHSTYAGTPRFRRFDNGYY